MPAFFHSSAHRAACFLSLLVVGANFYGAIESAQAGDILLRGRSSPSHGQPGAASGSSATTSQTATEATTATAQSALASAQAKRAGDILSRSLSALQAQQAVQNAARNLNLGSSVPNGLTSGGLVPDSGLPTPLTGPALQAIDLSARGNTVTFSKGGTVILPTGTSTHDQVTLSGSGTVTTQGAVTATSGTLTTTTGGTLSTTTGGSITTSSAGGTIVTQSSATLTPTTAGTLTLPGGGTVISLAANTPVNVPAGGKITLNGQGTVTIAGDATDTVTLSGAGTLTLAGTPGAGGGVITANSGITAFSGSAVSALPAGSTVTFSAGGSFSFAGAGNDSLPVILPSSVTDFATSGAVLSTTSYHLPASWTNVGSLSQSVTAGALPEVTVSIQQTKQQALLNWNTFNLGTNTTLDFDQSLGGVNIGDWVAINRVTSQIAPSQILGHINAGGQVYVIDPNGILFGASSQVNTHALVASALAINPHLLQNGLLNNSTDDAYLFSSLQDANGNALFTPGSTPTLDSGGNSSLSTGGVTVEAGAQLTAPTTAEHIGGKIVLVGPSVDNEGTISTPDGQTLLAAGLQVGLKAHDSNDPSLRGLDPYLGAVKDSTYDQNSSQDPSGTVRNGGLIEAPRAEVTMAGATVLQNGVIDASTSVALNGRVDLLADYNAVTLVNAGSAATPLFLDPTQSGSVVFGPSSVTQILPELGSTDAVVGSRLALSSLVNVQARDIRMETGSLLWAPSADTPADGSKPAEDAFGAALNSGVTFNAGSWELTGQNFNFVNDTGTIGLDAGAAIDVAGSQNVSASVLENLVTAQLRGTELADSPLQQNGPLRGQTVTIDLSQYGKNADGSSWIGSPIGDLSGYVGLVQHSVGELTTSGGTVALNAGNKVDLAAGSTVDVSGGWINYQGADVQTTKVISDGRILDISQATPDRTYDGILTGYTQTSAKLGISQTYFNSATAPRYEEGYVQGGKGGGVSITAPQITLGNLAGNTVAGVHQRSVPAQIPTSFGSGTTGLTALQSIYGLPQTASLSLSFTRQNSSGSSITVSSPHPADILFQPGDGTGILRPDPFAGDSLIQVLNLPADLVSTDGFGNLSISDGNGNIAVLAGAALRAQPGSVISLEAANIEVEDRVVANGGSLSFKVDVDSPYLGNDFSYSVTDGVANRGNFTLGPQAVLDVSGLLVNEMPGSFNPGETPFFTSGGAVSIGGYAVSLASGSVIDASGGVTLAAAGNQTTFGNAGTISIRAGQGAAAPLPGQAPLPDAQLDLGATLEGYSGSASGSGTLNLQAPLIQIGGASLPNGDGSSHPVAQEGTGVWGDGTTLWLNPSNSTEDFFRLGGFGTISLTAAGNDRSADTAALLVAPGTNLHPLVSEWLSSLVGKNIVLSSAELPLASERAPLHLSLNTSDFTDQLGNPIIGNIVVAPGANLSTDPQGSIALNAGNNRGGTIVVQGNITAPGGTIAIKGGSSSNAVFNLSNSPQPLATVDIAGHLSTAGTTELTLNPYGYRTGTVLDGGTISVTGNIVTETTALLDVSGTSGQLDVPPRVADTAQASPFPYVRTPMASNGGSIYLNGAEELYSEATLSGAAGGAGARGGSLTISTVGFVLAAPPSVHNVEDPTLVVTGAGPTIQALGSAVIGHAVQGTNTLTDRDGNSIYGYFSAAKFNDSGLEAFNLVGTTEFHGPVALRAGRSISLGNSGFLFADDSVTLTAPDVSLGTSLPTPSGQQSQEMLGSVFVDNLSGAFYARPAYGANGVLNVNGSTVIDVGDLSLQGIGTVNFNQTGVAGDVRGAGTLDVAGNINIKASQIYPTTENTFTLAAFLDPTAGAVKSGNVVLKPAEDASLPSLPYSAGGTLNIYADNIVQGGVLRAPMGRINLGAASSTQDILSVPGTYFDQAKSVTLLTGSLTSVSAVDPQTGQALIIPYGQNENGTAWIDPAGNDITASGNGAQGVPAKDVNLVGLTVTDDPGATIDLTGGGDLYAYRFVSGTGGTKDILSTASNLSEGSFAVLPNYQSAYAPIDATNGYVSGNNLSVGDRIYLNASNGLPAGYYTLLPSRYALLPGAFLVTPQSSGGAGSIQPTTRVQADGSSLVSGYRYTGLSDAEPGAPASGYSSFQISSQSVVRARAEYDDSFANAFLLQSAAAHDQPAPRLPVDAGQVVFNATRSLTLNGGLRSQPGNGGLGSLVDISSSNDILVNSTGTAPVGFNGLVLGTGQLDALNAGSLLIGGTRASDGATVTVATDRIEVDDAAHPLTGNDIALVSGGKLTLDDGAVIRTGAGNSATEAPSLVIGKAANDSFRLEGSGSNIPSLPAGTIIEFPQGIPVGDQINVAGNFAVTTPDGIVTAYPAGNLPAIAAGSTVTLMGLDTLSLAGGTVPVKIIIPNVVPQTGSVGSVALAQQISGAISNAVQVTSIFSGDGTLLRVSASQGAQTTRTNVNVSDTAPLLTLGNGVRIEGTTGTTEAPVGSLILDSTAGVDLSSSAALPAVLSGDTLTFNGGLISVLFPDYTGVGNAAPTTGLVLTDTQVKALQQNARNLSFLSYSSLDFYGDGTLGVDDAQNVILQDLSFHAAEMREFAAAANTDNQAGSPSLGKGVNLDVLGTISVDNAFGAAALPSATNPPSGSGGSLSFNSSVFQLGGGSGVNSFSILGFGEVGINAAKEVVMAPTASVTHPDGSTTNGQSSLDIADAGLTVTTPVITGATGAHEQIKVDGSVTLLSTGEIDSTLTSGLGASLEVDGDGINDAGNIVLSSGNVNLTATDGNGGKTGLIVGGLIDVGGVSPAFPNLKTATFTDGGGVSLSASGGNVALLSGGEINVSAASGTGTSDSQAGNAGTLSVSASSGTFTTAGILRGQGGVVTAGASGPVLAQGQDGNFVLDAAFLASEGGLSDLTSLEKSLAAGDFGNSQAIRIRTGSVEAIDAGSLLTAHTVQLSADQGDLRVDGRIDASGWTGGTIGLEAAGKVILSAQSVLTVEGQVFDDAGKGGSVSLQAGSFTGSTPLSSSAVDIAGRINLQVDYLPVQLNTPASPSYEGDSISLVNSGSTLPGGTFYLPQGTPGDDTLLIGGRAGGTITTAGVTSTFTGATLSQVAPGSVIKLNDPAATLTFASGSGGALPLYLASDALFTSKGATNPTGGAALPALLAGDVGGTLHLRGPALDSGGNVIGINGNPSPAGVAVGPITGQIQGASHIVVEGYQVYQPAGGIIDSVEAQVSHDGTALVSHSPDILQNLYAGNAQSAALATLTTIEPGAEVVNPAGDLVLQNTWDLSALSGGGGLAFHFGAENIPGILTLRAAGNLVFNAGASLNDGFDLSQAAGGHLWQAPLLSPGIRSWSYHLIAGADLNAADPDKVETGAGSLKLGYGSADVDATAVTTSNPGALLSQFYQTIRTGTGDIDISAGQNVELLNALTTIYTSGMQVANAQQVLAFDYNDFALPNLVVPNNSTLKSGGTSYRAQYSMNGGNVTVSAQGNIGHYTGTELAADSSRELPTSWLERQGFVENGVFAAPLQPAGPTSGTIASTSWWVDFSNFLEGFGALGGGNVVLMAGQDIINVDAVVPTNARMPGLNSDGQGIAPNASTLVELGGGDLIVRAGNDIDGGVFYVERGQGFLSAGNSIVTNSTRASLSRSDVQNLNSLTPDATTWLPTTLFLGQGAFEVAAQNNVLLGPVANPFLLPQSVNNSFLEKSYFSTYGADDEINVRSLTGDVVLKDSTVNGAGSLADWYENVLSYVQPAGSVSWSNYEPWLRLSETLFPVGGSDPFDAVYGLMPATLRATAFSGSIGTLGDLTLSPSAQGTVDLVAAGAINGLQPNGITNVDAPLSTFNQIKWATTTINLSDADPGRIPGVAAPLAPYAVPATVARTGGGLWPTTNPAMFNNLAQSLTETGATDESLQTRQALHADIGGRPLHADDPNPVQIYAEAGDVSGVTLFAGKPADIVAGRDIADIAFYLQNNQADEISVVSAGRDIVAYDPNSALRVELQNAEPENGVLPLAGDIQIGGPGTIEVLSGRNLNLGVSPAAFADGIGLGLTSIGQERNPFDPGGSSIIAAAGLGANAGLDSSHLNFDGLVDKFLDPQAGGTEAGRYLPLLGELLGMTNATNDDIWNSFSQLPPAQRGTLALTIFYDVLRDAGRDYTALGAAYTTGSDAIATLFPTQAEGGDITLTSREIKTEAGGDISLLAPVGQITVGLPVAGTQAVDQGILTVDGGNISIFANDNVNVGTSRIFTLHGGNEIIWSSIGNIAAGASSKTVQSAPPTRVIVDLQSGNVETDLAGLATGGGIGVLQTIVGAPPADVDLVAPKGAVDAGDAGIRASGNVNIAAVQVLNAANITVGGKSSGVPTVAAPNIAGLSAASSAAGAADNAASQVAKNNQPTSQPADLPSLIVVEVLGYGGGDTDN